MDGRTFAEELAGAIAEVVGEQLVGVYLHGSLALEAFDPARSDVDLLVVVRGPLDPGEREALLALFRERSGDPYPLELSVLALDDLHPWRHPAPYRLHFSETTVADPGADPDLAAHVTVVRARGVVLAGAPIEAVFPEVPAEDFRAAVLPDLEWSRAHGQWRNAALNACRVRAWLDTGALLSKPEGVDWAWPRLSESERHLVAAALAGEPCAPDEVEALVSRLVPAARARARRRPRRSTR